MIDQLLTFIPAHEAKLLALFGSIFSLLSLVFGFFRRTVWLSKIFGTVSPADLGRVLRYAGKTLTLIKQWRDMRSATNVLISTGIVTLLCGCAGTFEEAKIAGIQARALSTPVAAATPERCQSLSEREYWFTGTSIGAGAVAATAAGLVLPVQSQSVDTALIVTAASAGVVATGAGWFGASAGAEYVREGCPK